MRAQRVPGTPAHPTLAACLALALVGCAGEALPAELGEAEDEGEVARSEAALLGGTHFPDPADTDTPCNNAQQMVVRSAAVLGRTIVQGTAFEKCVQTNFDMPYVRTCSTDDPYFNETRAQRVVRAIAVARSPIPASITCPDLDGALGETDYDEELLAPNGLEDMRLDIDSARIANVRVGNMTDVALIANTMWHEAAHAHGYDEDYDQNGCGGVPWMVGDCVQYIAEQSAALCSSPSICPRGSRIAVASAQQLSFQTIGATYTGSGTCQCLRDPLPITGLPAVDAPPYPVLDVNEAVDASASAVAMGDFNGDGLDDAVVGAPGESIGGLAGVGVVYVYEGTALGLYPTRKLTQDGVDINDANDEFGTALAVEDFNVDGYDDLAVGAPGENAQSGYVYVYPGSPAGLTVGVLTLSQAGLATEAPGDRFGDSLAVRTSGVGRPQLIVGAPHKAVGGARSGQVFVYLSQPANPMLTAAFSLTQTGVDSNEEGDLFGYAVAAGRLDGDQIDDIVVGATGENSFGAVYVFNSQNAGMAPPGKRKLVTPPLAGGFGHALAVGRFTSTSFRQLAVGALGSGTLTFHGAVFVYDARDVTPEPANRLLFTFGGPQAFGFTGSSLVTLPGGEGFDRLAVGSSGGAVIPGLVHVLQGQAASMSLVQALGPTVLDGNEAEDLFGWSLARGRVVADGSDDLLVGIPGEGLGTAPDGSGAFAVFRQALGTFLPWKIHTQAD